MVLIPGFMAFMVRPHTLCYLTQSLGLSTKATAFRSPPPQGLGLLKEIPRPNPPPPPSKKKKERRTHAQVVDIPNSNPERKALPDPSLTAACAWEAQGHKESVEAPPEPTSPERSEAHAWLLFFFCAKPKRRPNLADWFPRRRS